MPILGPLGVKFLAARGISNEVGARFGIYTAKALGAATRADRDGNVIAFPFFEDERVAAIKYRWPEDKRFWQKKGGKRIFWNVDALDLAIGEIVDEDGRQTSRNGYPLIITEGELDALTAIQCGFECAVSVPDGAPSAQRSDAIDDDGRIGKFAFMWDAREKLALIKQFVIAVDNDEPGQLLAEEIVRRLGAGRCLRIEYPEGCKDLNDVLMKHGAATVQSVLNGAQRYPTEGVYRLTDYPDRPPIQGYEVGWRMGGSEGETEAAWKMLNDHFKVFPGGTVLITGIPGHGKSSFALNVIANLYDRYRWRSAIISPEMPVVPHLRDTLRSMRMNKASGQLSDSEKYLCDEWINDTFIFIDNEPPGHVSSNERTIDWVLDKAAECVMSHGIRVLLIDPWNELEHETKRGENFTDYVGRCLRTIRRFAQHHGVVVFIVAHPTKDVAGNGKIRPPSLYDIEGSAHWFNKPDHGIVIYREEGKAETEILIRKVRFQPETGTPGRVLMAYNAGAHRFHRVPEKQPERPERVDYRSAARLTRPSVHILAPGETDEDVAF